MPILGHGWAIHGALQMLLACEAVLALYFLINGLLSSSADSVFDDVMALRGLKEVRYSRQARHSFAHPIPITETNRVKMPQASLCDF